MRYIEISKNKKIEIRRKKYEIKNLVAAKEKLNSAKSLLDAQSKEFYHAWGLCDPFKFEKKIIAKLANNFNVTNAWIKCYELINYFNLADPNKTRGNPPFLHFDNAAFPGSFILAAHHYITTRRPNIIYDWRASSINLDNYLEDSYGLYKNYKGNWLMDEKNNGDVCLVENQMDFQKKIGGQVTLYTSDLGFDVSSDYNNQELLQLNANVGQIISGLQTLGLGGNFLTKQYSIFEPVTISIIYACTMYFENFYVAKPYTSREANSEVYLVGKGFIGTGEVENSEQYIGAMREAATDFVPIFDVADYDKKFINNIVGYSKLLAESQTTKIKNDVRRCNAWVDGDKEPINEFHNSAEYDINNWYKKNYILPIDDEKRLNVLNKY